MDGVKQLCDTEVHRSGGQREVADERERDVDIVRRGTAQQTHTQTAICCCKALIEDRKHNKNQPHDASEIPNQARCFDNKKLKTLF